MNIERLESRLEKIICDIIHWQDLFQTHLGILNEPFSQKDFETIKKMGRLRYINNSLFNERVNHIAHNVINEIQKTITEEGL